MGKLKKIKNIFYKIEGIDKLFIFKILNLVKKGIFINIMILLWRWKINNKELF